MRRSPTGTFFSPIELASPWGRWELIYASANGYNLDLKRDVSRGGDRVRGGHEHIGKASSMGLENALYKV